jgi:hypothetical protein
MLATLAKDLPGDEWLALLQASLAVQEKRYARAEELLARRPPPAAHRFSRSRLAPPAGGLRTAALLPPPGSRPQSGS